MITNYPIINNFRALIEKEPDNEEYRGLYHDLCLDFDKCQIPVLFSREMDIYYFWDLPDTICVYNVEHFLKYKFKTARIIRIIDRKYHGWNNGYYFEPVCPELAQYMDGCYKTHVEAIRDLNKAALIYTRN
jgi:hypothetical protein